MNSLRNNIVHPDNYWKIRKTILRYKYFNFQDTKHWYIRQLNMIHYFIKGNQVLTWY